MPETITRAEHLAWCKQRALEELDAGRTKDAVVSMLSDLNKHEDTRNHIGGMLGAGLMFVPGWIENVTEVRHWIEGFN